MGSEPMRILVTGGGGFIGSAVVDRYIRAGHRVLVVDHRTSGRSPFIHRDAEYERADLRDGDLDGIFQRFRPHAVNHHAGHASVPASVKDPLHDAAVNILGSIRLLEAARKSGVEKVIYPASGGSTYGPPLYLPVDEEHPIAPASPYAVSKHTVEHYLQIYHSLYGLPFTTLRYANVYGPRQSPRGEGGVVAVFIGRMLEGKSPTIFGTGQDERDYVYVSDVAEANELALTLGSGSVVNIGTGVGTSVCQLYDELKKSTGYTGVPVYAPLRPGDVPSIRLNPARAGEVLGWHSRTSLADGIRETVDWFRAHAA